MVSLVSARGVVRKGLGLGLGFANAADALPRLARSIQPERRMRHRSSRALYRCTFRCPLPWILINRLAFIRSHTDLRTGVRITTLPEVMRVFAFSNLAESHLFSTTRPTTQRRLSHVFAFPPALPVVINSR